MNLNLQSGPNRKALVAAMAVTLVLVIATAVVFFAFERPVFSPRGPGLSFDVAWQRGVQETTARFHAEVARIGRDRNLLDEARQAAMIAAQDRHRAEMDAINKNRLDAVQGFQRKTLFRSVGVLALLGGGTTVILWMVFRRFSMRENLA